MKMTPAEFGRYWRRRELARLAACLVIVGGLAIALVWLLATGRWGLGTLLATGFYGGGIAVAALLSYVHDVLRGRVLNPPDGAVTLVQPASLTRGHVTARLTVRLADRETALDVSSIAAARHVMAYAPFDDLKGLEDVLELDLIGGARVRVPATCDGFCETLGELRGYVSVCVVEV